MHPELQKTIPKMNNITISNILSNSGNITIVSYPSGQYHAWCLQKTRISGELKYGFKIKLKNEIC